LAAIDHVIIACRDPDAAAADFEQALGLRATGGGRHDLFGTFNRLVWLGDSFVELIGVFDEDLAERSWFGGHVVGLLSERPAAYAGIALATTDLAADVSVLRAQVSPILDPVDGQRVRPDGRVVRWRTAGLPEPDQDLGLAFLIEHDATAAEWTAEDRLTRGREIHPIGSIARLARVELSVSAVARTQQRLHRDLGLAFRPSLAGGGARDSSIGSQSLRLAPGQALPTIAVSAGDSARSAEVLGVRWILEPRLSGS
jgi:catechol 2,3-dioxygenase-like lactoylglutathione lyase family enzyme